MTLVNGTALDTPVGPPWMTTSSGYFLVASKSSGLCSTPSMVVPSWLFHETISSALVRHFAVCAEKSVSFVGRGACTAPASSVLMFAANTSGSDSGSEPTYATVDPSRERLNAVITALSAGARRTTARVCGSRRYRYDHVRCSAPKNRPFGFHATGDGSSSKPAVRTVGMPPADATVAITEFA